jgi:hypothetical protein
VTTLHVCATCLGLSVLIGFLLPGPGRRDGRSADLGVALLSVAGLGLATALAFAAAAVWEAVPVALTLAVCALILSIWVAGTPGRDDEDDDPGGGGGGPPKRDPTPPRPSTPDGPAIDWTDFDVQRAHWGDQKPIGV